MKPVHERPDVYLDKADIKFVLSKLTSPSNKYDYLIISKPNDLGGKNSPFELLSATNNEQFPIKNNVYTKNLALQKGCSAQVDIGFKLQIQNEISSSLYCLNSSQKLVKRNIDHKNNCLIVLSQEGKEVASFYKKHYEVTTKYGSKNNPFYKLVVRNNLTLTGNEEIFVQNMIISNKCKIEIKNCKLSIANSIVVSDEQVQENFDKYNSEQLLGIGVKHDANDVL